MDPDKDTAELNAMLTADRHAAAQERDAARARLAALAEQVGHVEQVEQVGHVEQVAQVEHVEHVEHVEQGGHVGQAEEVGQVAQVMREETDLIDYLTGRHDFVLEDMEASLHPDDLCSFLDQRLTEYIASADSLQKVKGFSSVAVEVNDFRLSC
ncbi:MAG: hypothetical protein DI630_12595 [Gordonia sp. (in: high G+C Gram-positive bacteria)]|nr:MAG: hypothetical protein DI630_12595 [Gordonia sp. (in: high G+C Gram-positive bacteria)]